MGTRAQQRHSAINVIECPGNMRTIEYNGKPLYSKHSPARAILQSVERMNILPGTLILACSPALCYGIRELLQKLPEDCLVLAAECDAELYEFAWQELRRSGIDTSSSVLAFSANTHTNPDFYRPAGTFRRVVRIDLSAGTQISATAAQWYARLHEQLQSNISAFWKNRLTLIRMGRLFCRNMLRNLPVMARQTHSFLEQCSVACPIIVCGAGESLSESIPAIKRTRSSFILAVDAAAAPLLQSGIRPDAIVTVESQLAIEKAFYAAAGTGIPVFADLSSRTHAARITGGPISFFSTEFTSAHFLKELREKNLFPCAMPPLGSVGLYALELALRLRERQDIPVFVTGLDFSYSIGRTHANGTAQHTERLIASNRLTPIENYAAAFKPDARAAEGKDRRAVITDTALCGYNANFAAYFRKEAQVFDMGTSGLPLALPCAPQSALAEADARFHGAKKFTPNAGVILRREDAAGEFIRQKKAILRELIGLLSEGDGSDECATRVRQILEENEFLYVHFPDGHRMHLDRGFLNRIRHEAGYFLRHLSSMQ